jgi:hypothetical protein
MQKICRKKSKSDYYILIKPVIKLFFAPFAVFARNYSWEENEMKKNHLLKNEEGFVLVVSLIMLALLSLLGVAATNTSTLEIKIADNNRRYTQNFYMAESAIREALQRITNNDGADNRADTGIQATTSSWVMSDAPLKAFLEIEYDEEEEDTTPWPSKPVNAEKIKNWLLEKTNTVPAVTNDPDIPDNEKPIRFAAIGPIAGATGGGGGRALGRPTRPGASSQVFIVYGVYNKTDEPNRGQVILDAGYRLVQNIGP